MKDLSARIDTLVGDHAARLLLAITLHDYQHNFNSTARSCFRLMRNERCENSPAVRSRTFLA